MACAASATLVTPALALLGLVSPKAQAGGSPESSCPQHLPDSIALTASLLPLASPLGLHSLQETYEAKRKEFLSELQRKEEEMRQMFVNKVKETELELKEKEREVCVRPAAERKCQGRLADGDVGDLVCPFPELPPFSPPQLHEKFEHLKRIHQEEKRKVEEKRRELEEETNAFNCRKAAMEALQSQALHATSQQPLRKDKDKKK